MRVTKNHNRILGSLLGFAIGDAMGATTEFMNPKQIRSQYGEVTEILGGGWLHLYPGEVTDDTQMMVIVAKARMTGKEHFLQNCCKGFVDWLKGDPRDVGGACRTAIMDGNSKSPDEWMRLSEKRQKASNRLDLGNGAVMRALFPALMGESTLAVDQGRLTHNNSISDYYVEEYCLAVAKVLNGEFFNRDYSGLMNPTGHVRNSVNNAIYWALQARSFSEAIIGPVNHGGDADTIAALAGGIAGARFGVNLISKKWIDTLDPNVVEDLKSMANWIMEN